MSKYELENRYDVIFDKLGDVNYISKWNLLIKMLVDIENKLERIK